MSSSSSTPFANIDDAIADFKNGQFVLVMDDESRENEGDLIIAAESMTQEQMAFLVRWSSGFICAPLSTELADKLQLHPMVQNNTDRHSTAYTVTCDVKIGTTTGISAHDRAKTVRHLADANAKPDDFTRPGHIVPLRAVPGLLNERTGHTEAAIQLCQLAGKKPAAAICELVREKDGLMMRLDDCIEFCQKHNIKIITIKQLIEKINT